MTEPEKSNLPLPITGSARHPQPNGWWKIPGDAFTGSRAGVLKAIATAKFKHLVDNKEVEEDIPQRWKDMAIAEIGELPAEYNHVTMHAHVSISPSPAGRTLTRTYDFDIIGKIQL